jgi:hypothetical protein
MQVVAILLFAVLWLEYGRRIIASPMEDLIFLTDYVATGARCLDGSPAAFYIIRNPIDKWVIFLKGGGWCYTLDDCVGRSGTADGSSTGYSLPFNPAEGGNGILSSDPDRNPHFYNWNLVFVPYCDGGSFAGNNPTPVVHSGETLYFRGHLNFRAVIDYLLQNENMDAAEDIVLAGCSAGALATYFKCDDLAELVISYDINVRCMADGGFFANFTSLVTHTGIIQEEFNAIFAMQQMQDGVNQDCIANVGSFPPEACMFPQFFLPFIQTPIFVLNSLYDDWQMPNIWLPTAFGNGQPRSSYWEGCLNGFPGSCSTGQLQILAYYHNASLYNIKASWQNNNLPQVGSYITDCYGHCWSSDAWMGPTSNAPTIPETGGQYISDAFFSWWSGTPTKLVAFFEGECCGNCVGNLNKTV